MGIFHRNLESVQPRKEPETKSKTNIVKSGLSHKNLNNPKSTNGKRSYTHSVKSINASGVITKVKNRRDTRFRNTFRAEASIKKYKNVPKEDINIATVENSGSKLAHTLISNKVQSSVSALLQLKNASSSSKTVPLFNEDAQTVYMKVKCIKIPKMTFRNFRFQLPHPLVDESSEICFLVPDLQKGKKVDHEPTIEHYKELFRQNNITGISQIIPLRQMLVEYSQYEARRHLVSQFDMFLADGRICGHMLQRLGKEIYKKRRLPVPVDMRKDNLKHEVDLALSKTSLMMQGHSNEATLRIGHTNHSVNQLVENIMAVAKGLSETYPGGWGNIRSLDIFLHGSPLIPVYITLKSSNLVKAPVMVPVPPKKAVPVEGELTTFLGAHVTVMPSGKVIIEKMKRSKEDKEMDLSDSDFGKFKFDKKKMKEAKAKKRIKVDRDSDSKKGPILSGKRMKVSQNSEFDIEVKEEEDSDAETMAENSYFSDDDDDEEGKKVNQKKMKGGNKNKTVYTDKRIKVKRVSGSEKRVKEESKDADDENEVSEAAENAYLKQWARQWNSNIEETSKLKQKKGVNETKMDRAKKKQITVKNKKELLVGGKIKRMENKIRKGGDETKVNSAKKKQITVKNKELLIGGKIKRKENKIGKGVSETKVNPIKKKQIVKNKKEHVIGGKIKRKEKKLPKESKLFKKETAQTVKDTRPQKRLKTVEKTVKKGRTLKNRV